MTYGSWSRSGVKGVLVATAISSPIAFAQDVPFPPPQKTICAPNNFVDKEKLATYLLRKYPVSALAVATVATAEPRHLQQANSSQKLLAVLLNNLELCKKSCTPSDVDLLGGISGDMIHVMLGHLSQSYKPTREVLPSELFGPDARNQIQCMVTAEGRPIEAAGSLFTPPPASKSNFRVRGNANHLSIDRSSQQEFAATEKSIANLSNNHLTESKTTKLVGVIGYSIPGAARDGVNGNRLEIIPYVGINRNVVNVSATSTVKPSLSDTRDIGVLFSKFTPIDSGAPEGYLINIRPDYLADYKTSSRLLSLNLEYVPVINSVLNSFIPLADGLIGLKPIFSVKNNYGHFSDRGDATVAASNRDYVRLGVQVGVAVVSNIPLLPLDASTTYVKLGARNRDTAIGYSKTAVNLSLDPKKYVGIGLSYAHGKREDTGKSEKLGEVGLTVRF